MEQSGTNGHIKTIGMEQRQSSNGSIKTIGMNQRGIIKTIGMITAVAATLSDGKCNDLLAIYRKCGCVTLDNFMKTEKQQQMTSALCPILKTFC